MRNVFDIHCTDNDLSPHIQRNLKRKHKNNRSTSKNQPHINGFSHGWSSFLLSRWIFHILFLGKMFRGGAKKNAKLEKKTTRTSPSKKNKGISKNSTNRCWNRNLKCWNGPSKKTCKKKLPLEGLKLVFCFFFLWDRGRCVSIHAPRLPRPGTCMFPMRQRKEWPHLRVENLRKSTKQAKDRASNQPNFVGYIW